MNLSSVRVIRKACRAERPDIDAGWPWVYCPAKRRVIILCRDAIDAGEIQPYTTCNDDAAGAVVGELVLRFLAGVYAQHPGYRPEWAHHD